MLITLFNLDQKIKLISWSHVELDHQTKTNITQSIKWNANKIFAAASAESRPEVLVKVTGLAGQVPLPNADHLQSVTEHLNQ